MGVIDYNRPAERLRRLHYVWSWRIRYWWMDTDAGKQANVMACCIGVLVVVLQLVRMGVAATMPPPAGEPVKAIYWWVVQLIIAIVAAVASYAMRPKPQQPKPQEGTVPVTEDGLAAKHYFGECWIEDEFQLAYKNVGTIPIKSKGGKK